MMWQITQDDVCLVCVSYVSRPVFVFLNRVFVKVSPCFFNLFRCCYICVCMCACVCVCVCVCACACVCVCVCVQSELSIPQICTNNNLLSTHGFHNACTSTGYVGVK